MQDACCVAHLNNKQTATPEQLQEALKHISQSSKGPNSLELYDFDHIYSSDPKASFQLWQAGNATAAVLYATPGTQCFPAMHKLLKDAMAAQYAQGTDLLTRACHTVIRAFPC